MARYALSTLNRVDGGTVTVSGAVSGLPAANVQDTILRRVCRSQATSWQAVVDFGAAHDVDVVALGGIGGASASATLRVELDSSDTFGGGYDSGTVAAGLDTDTGYALHLPGATQIYRYMRVTLADTGAAFLDVGRLWAGGVFRPGIGPTYDGYSEGRVDASEVERAPWSGAQFVDQRASWRFVTPIWRLLTEAEALDTCREIARRVGARGQVLVLPNTESSRLAGEAFFGRPTEPAQIQAVTYGYWSVGMRIEESK